MHSETESAVDRWAATAVDGWVALTRWLKRGAVVAVGLAWMAFWGVVGRIHLRSGDLLSAAVVGGLLVLPAVVWLGYALRGALPGGRDG